MPPRYLEDLEIGQCFRTDSYTLTEEKLKAFAAEYDPQPFHLDNDAAEKTVFRGLAASGWQTASIMMRLVVTSGMRLAGGAIGLGGELSWPRPTRPGDTLRVQTEVLDVRYSKTKPGQGIVSLRHTTFNQSDEPVCVFTCKVLGFRRPGSAE